MSILVLLGAALVFAPVSDAKTKAKSKPRKSDGSYTLTVAGFYTGTGRAVVSSGSIALSLSVTKETGGKGGNVLATMPLVNNRFSGDATLSGLAVHFEGRLDVPDDDKERTLRGVRLVCRMRVDSLTSAGMTYASVVGFVPELAGAKDGIDEGEETNKGKGKDKD